MQKKKKQKGIYDYLSFLCKQDVGKNNIMKKSTINFIINAVMFICMSAIAGIGFLIKYTLITGQERWVKYGENIELYVLGMDRHEWGLIHLILGFILLGLLALHVILHWTQIVCIYNRICQKKAVRKLITLLFGAICALLLLLPFVIKPTVVSLDRGQGRQINTITITTSKEYNKTDTYHEKEINNTKPIRRQQHADSTFDIKGYMTLDEVSIKYNVPTEYIKTKLNLSQSISDQQKLNWLKKKHNIKMHDIKKIIKEYQETNE